MLNHTKNHNNDSFSTNTNESTKVVVYARISREKNHGSDVSLDNQIACGRNWASLNGYSVVAEYIEVKSAKKASNRPEFQKAIKKIKEEKSE